MNCALTWKPGLNALSALAWKAMTCWESWPPVTRIVKDEKVIVTIDKDLKTIPGLH